ncbi:MAG TPA: phycobilisome rod-core linker polypeptide [Synechococcales cyanobacterium M55_K2018_004]|nr:phycobilisome rod-core linker polypeptide [Synechococcales cyanobacterium M55_K2018_004]
MKPLQFSTPIHNHPSAPAEKQAVLRQIYQQVLERQPYAHEQRVLAPFEQKFLIDKIGVRRFVKELAHSSVYLDAFYYRSSNMKFIERSCRHFLGRSLIDHKEMQQYCTLLMQEGVSAFLTALLDSEEYRKAFGCFTVPHQQTPTNYASPNVYLESKWLCQEHLGQRGHALPTLYWHQLGLTCDRGICRHPEAAETPATPLTPQGELLLEDLMALLQTLDARDARAVVAGLSPEQKQALRQAIHR